MKTALDIHELSDVMPAKMHMTVPLNFRRRIETPKVLCLYYDNSILKRGKAIKLPPR